MLTPAGGRNSAMANYDPGMRPLGADLAVIAEHFGTPITTPDGERVEGPLTVEQRNDLVLLDPYERRPAKSALREQSRLRVALRWIGYLLVIAVFLLILGLAGAADNGAL
jgi:hypothetical protein